MRHDLQALLLEAVLSDLTCTEIVVRMPQLGLRESGLTAGADLGAEVEIRNQARVHLWYEDRCVGVTSTADGPVVHAPYGLEDVFALHLRPNPGSRQVRCTRSRSRATGCGGRR